MLYGKPAFNHHTVLMFCSDHEIKGRTITRTRDAQGHEESRDLLNNINVHDTAAFDQEWMHHATHSLPGNTENQRSEPRCYSHSSITVPLSVWIAMHSAGNW